MRMINMSESCCSAINRASEDKLSPHRIALLQVFGLSAKQVFPNGRMDEFQGVQEFDLSLAVSFSETEHLKKSQSYAIASIFQSAGQRTQMQFQANDSAKGLKQLSQLSAMQL